MSFQVTHGFPQNPSPLFRSTKFNIENRPGIEDQRIEQVMSALSSLDAPNILDSRQSKGDDTAKRIELAKWLSDWHLVAFLETTQLFPPVCPLSSSDILRFYRLTHFRSIRMM